MREAAARVAGCGAVDLVFWQKKPQRLVDLRRGF